MAGSAGASLRGPPSCRRGPWLPWRRLRKRRAVVTIVHNEPVFLPIWLGYYSRFFAAEDIYVLDNESTDGSTDARVRPDPGRP